MSNRKRGYGYDEMMRVLDREEYEQDEAYHADCCVYNLHKGSSHGLNESDPCKEIEDLTWRQFDRDLETGRRNWRYSDSLV
jgi:hypothetical protein